MNISITDVIGPVMIGPSSSHTAGAAKLSLAAASFVKNPIKKVSFGLYGSFAKTYKGHGTDIALVGGVLGIMPDDERLTQSFKIAEKQKIVFDFYETRLDTSYENSVKITFTDTENKITEIIGASTGGGRMVILSVDGMKTYLTFESPSLYINLYDISGMLSSVSKVFADSLLNINQIQFMRKNKGESACCIISSDEKFPDGFDKKISCLQGVISAQLLPAF